MHSKETDRNALSHPSPEAPPKDKQATTEEAVPDPLPAPTLLSFLCAHQTGYPSSDEFIETCMVPGIQPTSTI